MMPLRTLLRPWWARALALALLVLAVTVPAWAQQRPGAPAEKGPSDRARLGELRRALLKKRVSLTDKEVDRVETITAKHAAERRRIRQDVRRAKRDLRRLFREDSDDQEAWRGALEAMEKARRAQHELRSAQYEELGSFLTPKQQAKLLRTLHEVKRELGEQRGKRGRPGKRGQPGPRGRGKGRGPR